jgi:hypothetical protein
MVASTRDPQAALMNAIADSESQEYPIAHHDQLCDGEVFDQYFSDSILGCENQHGQKAQGDP